MTSCSKKPGWKTVSLTIVFFVGLAFSAGLTFFTNLTDITDSSPVFAQETPAVNVQAVPESTDAPYADLLKSLSAVKSDWNGFVCYDFKFENRAAKIVFPKTAAQNHPWMWRARFFGHEPQTDIALLGLGFHVVYIDSVPLMGSPKSVALWQSFYEFLTKNFALCDKAHLEGMSRGGLYVMNWAIAYPDEVASIYIDNPVLNFCSWPGGYKGGKRSDSDWQSVLDSYELTEEQALAYDKNPLETEQLKRLAEKKVPILAVCGDADSVVPYKINAEVLKNRYEALNAPIEVILKPGNDHHPHSIKDPARIVAFVLKHQANIEQNAVNSNVGADSNKNDSNWYKGNLHMHSYWSDGRAFPEEAISLYKDSGYQFLCLSDHNLAQTNPKKQIQIGGNQLKQENFDRFFNRYPDFLPEIKENDGKKMVRLKTFSELDAYFNQGKDFLLIPGYELNGTAKNDGRQIHMNVINTKGCRPFQQRPSADETMDQSISLANELMSGHEDSTILMLNHPDWVYFDIDPQMLIDRDVFKFFEVCNCGPVYPASKNAWTCDKFWDVINAYRLEDKKGGLLYGIASDDTHSYDPFYRMNSTEGILSGGGGWIVVRAPELTTDSLMKSLYSGDFYASTGVVLNDVQFDADSKMLTVKVKPEEGVKYTISFIGTKKGFDRNAAVIDEPAKGNVPARTFTVYSDEIGQTFQSTEGTEASFKLTDDCLYVRAKIEADNQPARKFGGKPARPTAWTQPVSVLSGK